MRQTLKVNSTTIMPNANHSCSSSLHLHSLFLSLEGVSVDLAWTLVYLALETFDAPYSRNKGEGIGNRYITRYSF